MVQPAGFVHPQYPTHVCKLRKALYGLKQAPRAWYTELKGFLISLGFTNSVADPSLFIYNFHGVTVYFLVYVDDIIITGNSTTSIDKFVHQLNDRFALKDLGELNHFLGVEVISTKLVSFCHNINILETFSRLKTWMVLKMCLHQ